LSRIHNALEKNARKDEHLFENPSLAFFMHAYVDYLNTVEPALRFLQGKDPAIAHRIASRTLLPEGPRFQTLDDENLVWAFGSMGVQDQAKHIASLYIDDLTDVISAGVDTEFSLSRYGEKLASSQPTFDPLLRAVLNSNSLIDVILKEITEKALFSEEPAVLLLTVPFPGCVLGALKIAKLARQIQKEKGKDLKIMLGGGYVNTELRSIKDARIFDFVDAITLDDGERPIECLLEYWQGKRERNQLMRTFLRTEKITSAIEYCHSSLEHDIPQSQTGFPTLVGLPINEYISMVEMLNPMHRFWSDLHWNKLMLAHGCYWHKCNFCDVNLDYIKRYEVSPVQMTIERMKKLAAESSSTGFHFVDEAAPPAVLKELSKLLLEQRHSFSWWGNIRFEKTFNRELSRLRA
jgi:hypothetical protein